MSKRLLISKCVIHLHPNNLTVRIQATNPVLENGVFVNHYALEALIDTAFGKDERELEALAINIAEVVSAWITKPHDFVHVEMTPLIVPNCPVEAWYYPDTPEEKYYKLHP